MAAFRIFRRLRQLQDVDDTGIAQGDVPTYETAVSKFTMAQAAAGAAHSVSISGNTAGVPALIETGTWTLAGGNGITLSQAGNAVTISGGAAATQTFLGAISASDALYTSGTVRITGVGGGVTVSSNTGQRVDISVAAQSVQPETQTFVGGISASNTLYTSGSVRITGVGGGITVSSNTGQRIDLSVAAPVAQTVQTQNVVDLTLSGNTAGALALVSSGTATLAGGNNITLSQAGNAITISGPNVGGAQTGISGLANSQTTYTSGTVSLSELGAITIRSTTGNQFQLSVNAQSVQPETQTFIAGVSASDTLYTSGNVRITGVGGGITVSSNTGQRIDLSVAAQSVQPETQTFIAGISASNTLYTSGNVRISGSQAVTVRSGTGQLVVIDVPAQSVQPETQTFIAGVSASDTLYTSGNVRITGVGGGVTVSSNTGQRVDISVAAPVAATDLSIGVSTGGNTVGNTQVSTGSRFVLVASGNATASQATAAGASTVTISVGTQTVQTQNLHNVTLSGNTAGAMAHISSGTMTLAGGNNITVSQAGNAVTISGANVGGAQTGISGIANSQTTYTSGTVSLSELGAITIRSTTGNQFQFSVNAQSVQPETQTFIAGVSASDTLYTSGNVRITGVGGGITVSSNTGQRVDLSVAAQTNQAGNVYASSNTFGTSSGTYDARSISIAGRGAVSVAASNSGWIISAPTQSVQAETQTFIGGVAGSNTTYTSGTVSITGVGGGVTVSSNTGQRIDISVAAPVAQTNQSGNVYASSNTFGTSSGTYDARSISIAGRGAVSVAASNSGWIISAPAQSVQVETQTFVGGLANSQTTYTSGTVSFSELGAITIRSTTGNQFQFSVNSQTLQTSNVHNVTLSGNTAGAMAQVSSGTLTLAGGPNITLSQAGNAISISAAPAGGAGQFSAGVSTGGNTAGATGITGTQMVLVGSQNVSLSQTTGANGGTVSVIGPASSSLSAVAPLSISTNGATVSFLVPATSSLSATGAVEISTNGSTISIGAPNIKQMADWQNFPLAQATLMTHAASISKTPFYFPAFIPGRLTAKSFVIRLSAVTTATLQSFSVHAGFYTQVNGTSMALLGSWSESFVASTASSVSWSGIRNYVLTGIGTHTALSVLPGSDYVLGMMFSAGAAGSLAQSIMGAGSGGGPLGALHPGVNSFSTGTSQGIMALNGRGSTTVNALPANVVASELVNQGQGASMQLQPWIYIRS